MGLQLGCPHDTGIAVLSLICSISHFTISYHCTTQCFEDSFMYPPCTQPAVLHPSQHFFPHALEKQFGDRYACLFIVFLFLLFFPFLLCLLYKDRPLLKFCTYALTFLLFLLPVFRDGPFPFLIFLNTNSFFSQTPEF